MNMNMPPKTMPKTMSHSRISRRALGRGLVGGLLAAATAAAADPAPSIRRRGIPLGFDNFAVRAMGWNARELVDHAEKLGCDSLFITDFGPFGGQTDDDSLDEIGRYASDRGVGLELGSWSICPTSTTFRKDWGSAEDHLALGIRMAKDLGSKAFRVILGNHQDRLTAGGIDARIGPDFVGVNFDSGNALWTLEDPLAALETLAPYVVTTSLRDGQVWPSEKGVKVQWTAMGEGCVDLPTFFDHFQKHCPDVVVHIETISGFARELPFLEPDFWKAFPAMPAADFARFEALARRGHAIDPFQAPDGDARKGAEQAYQLADLERSLRYCRDTLGLGVRA